MKKVFCLLAISIGLLNDCSSQQTADTTIRSLCSQGISQRDKEFRINSLCLLGKLWGFLKYYHSDIAGGKYNWDNELITFLPVFTGARTVSERNDVLGSWMAKFPSAAACPTCNDSILRGAKLKPDLSWINEDNFSKPLVQRLRFIEANRIQAGQYYVRLLPSDGVNFIQFQHEALYSDLVFPNDGYGLLAVFRFWNAIEYWYPYKYNMPVSWDNVLKDFISRMLRHRNGYEYTVVLEELIATLHDGHGFFRSPLTDGTMGKYFMPFTVKLVESKLLITSILNDSLASRSNAKVGDIIEKIQGVEVPSLIKQFRATCPASNEGSLLHKMSYRLTRSNDKQCLLQLVRDGVGIQTTVYNYVPNMLLELDPPYFSYQKDSAFSMVGGNIAYINVGVFKRADSLALKELVRRASSLIIDCRQNQDENNGTGGGDIIGGLVMQEQNAFVRFSTAEPTFPGVFTLRQPTSMGVAGSKNPFKGNIIILINENTISVGEFATMAFQRALHVKTLGTTTSGADGNVAYILLPGNFFVQFSGLGVYYPDGKETQRVGIKPDIMVRQTIKGYRDNVDEQLREAMGYLQKKK